MLLRANALAKGRSGARPELVELLLGCLDRGVLPVVPSRGSVGRERRSRPARPSRAAARRRGRGVVRRRAAPRRRRRSSAPGSQPETLQAKEGLSLVNGTQFMAAFGALGLVRARRLAKTADIACALSLEALQGSRTSFLPQVHALRPLRGQQDSAANVLALLEGSAINESHRWCDKVQDAYSLRCAPQVHGATRDLLDYVDYTVSVELNAATDNPLVLVEDDLLVSNGNFHGQPLAFALDALAIGGRRAREHLGAPRRAARQPEPVGRAAAVPDRRGRPQLRLHDPAVRGRLARQREQGARPPGERRLDPDERRAGGSRLDGQHRRAEGVAGARATSSGRWRSSCSPARRGSSSSRRSSRAAGSPPRTAFVRSLSPRLTEDRPLGGEIEARRRRDPRRLARRGRRGRGRGAAVTDRPKQKRKLRWDGTPRTMPRHPYRDSAIIYAVLAGIVVGVTALTGGNMRAALIIAPSCSWSPPATAGGAGGSASESRPKTNERRPRRRGRGRVALRRPLADPGAARNRAERALVVDRGAAPHAAEQPRSGGRGAPRGARRLRRHRPRGAEPRRAAAIVRTLLRLGDDETLLVQSGKPVGVFRTHPGAPRVLIANSLLVPRWATWDEFRRLEALGLTMFGQMTAGSWIYIGTQGILQGTYQTFAAAAEQHFGAADLAGRSILTAGLGGMGGAQPLAGSMLNAAMLCVEVDPSRIERRLETRYLDEAADSLDDALARVRAAQRGPARPLGRAARQCGRGRAGAGAPRRAVRPRHRPDGGARPADRLRAGGARRRRRRRAARGRSCDVSATSPCRHCNTCPRDARVRPGRQLRFRLWQQPAR